MIIPDKPPANARRRMISIDEHTEFEGIELGFYDSPRGRLVTYMIPALGEKYTAEYLEDYRDDYGAERRVLSHIPEQYIGKTLKDFDWNAYNEDTSQQKRIAESIIARYDMFIADGHEVYIYSKTSGSGKTMLACCIANELIERRSLSAKFITVPRYVDLKYDDRYEYMSCALLILDDWDVQNKKQKEAAETLIKLIDHRRKHRLPTFYTSNRKAESNTNTATLLRLPEYSVKDENAKRKRKSFEDELLKDG